MDMISELQEVVYQCVVEDLNLSCIGIYDNLLIAGLDSLNATKVSHTLNFMLSSMYPGQELDFLQSELVFSNPTVSKLATAVYEGLFPEQNAVSQIRGWCEDLVARYAVHIDSKEVARDPCERVQSAVITGTTGSLGSCLLELLVRDKSIESIVCANRSKQGELRTKKILSHLKGDDWAKVTFERMEIKDGGLDLDPSGYKKIRDADALIHCAWSVNFMKPLLSFEGQIHGLKMLTEMLPQAARYQRLFFISSTGSQGYHQQPVQEAVLEDSGDVFPVGYAQSKFAAERILYEASVRHGLPITILRIGQIAGHDPFLSVDDYRWPLSLRPEWNRTEFCPSIIRSCRSLGKIPTNMRWPVDWLPMNTTCFIIRDIIAKDIKESGFRIYNIINPKYGQWSSIIEAIHASGPLDVVPYDEWLSDLKSHNSKNPDDLEKYPALRFLEIFNDEAIMKKRSLQTWRTDNTKAASATMAALEPINARMVAFWLKQWSASRRGIAKL